MFTILSICRGGGYRYARTDPPHPRRNAKGLYPLHRVLVENKIGRLLSENEVVHHIDGDRSNDDVGNLGLMLRDEHSRHHSPKLPLVMYACAHCGAEKMAAGHLVRLRRKRNVKNLIFCSRACGIKHHSAGW